MAFFRGRFQYGFLHFGQTRGSAFQSRGTHSCPHRMIKRKFGDSIRSRTETAMTNEVLCKVLCHNLVCVVHEMYELGIAPDFGGGAEPDEPRIIRFPGA